MAAVSRLDLPSRKMFIKDLQKACEMTTEENCVFTSLKIWKVTVWNNLVTFSIVWIQGKVTKVGIEEFLLDDSTGTVQVLSVNVPAACPKPITGQYMMVIGQLESSGDRPVVRANKLQDLTNDAALQMLWSAEVRDIYKQCQTTVLC